MTRRTPTSLTLVVLASLMSAPSCASLTTWQGTHAGIKYSIHKDQRDHRIERNRDGRLMYDSPELTVVSESGQLSVNGQPAGPLAKGDHVEVTSLGTVLVNGQRRGDKMTGRPEMQARIERSKALLDAHRMDRGMDPSDGEEQPIIQASSP